MSLSWRAVGKTKIWNAWILGFLFLICTVFWPVGMATKSYLVQPRTFDCKDISLRVPFLWQFEAGDFRDVCDNGASIRKLPIAMVGDWGTDLTVYQSPQPWKQEKTERAKDVFRMTHPAGSIAEFRLNERFPHCLSFGQERGDARVLEILCLEPSTGVHVMAWGTAAALQEAGTLVR